MEDEILEIPDYVEAESSTDENGVTVNVYLSTSSEADEAPVVVESDDPADEKDSSPVAILSLDDGSASGMLPSMVQNIFGDYTPRTQTVQTLVGSEIYTSQEIVPGLAGLDYYWLTGVVLFAIVLCSFFSLLRIVIRHN